LPPCCSWLKPLSCHRVCGRGPSATREQGALPGSWFPSPFECTAFVLGRTVYLFMRFVFQNKGPRGRCPQGGTEIIGILQSPRSPRRSRELARLGPRCRSPIDPRGYASVIAITLITHITGLSHYWLLAFSLSTISSRHHCVSYSRIVIIVTIARALTITMLYSYVTRALFTYTCAYAYTQTYTYTELAHLLHHTT
jgi:hypothetical protein